MKTNKTAPENYFQTVFEKVFLSEERASTGKLSKVKEIAQLLFARDRRQDKVDCACQALEWFEDMAGTYFDPTKEEFEDILCSII